MTKLYVAERLVNGSWDRIGAYKSLAKAKKRIEEFSWGDISCDTYRNITLRFRVLRYTIKSDSSRKGPDVVLSEKSMDYVSTGKRHGHILVESPWFGKYAGGLGNG